MADQAGRMADAARDRGGRVMDAAREQGGRMQDKSREAFQRTKSQAPTAGRVLGILAALAVAGTVMTVTTVGFVVASPFLILFSPILIPLGLMLLFGTGATAAFFSIVSWIYQYMKGRHPPGADKVDQVKRRIADTAHHLTERTQERVGSQ